MYRSHSLITCPCSLSLHMEVPPRSRLSSQRGKFRYSEYPEYSFFRPFFGYIVQIVQITQFHLKTGFLAYFWFSSFFSINYPHCLDHWSTLIGCCTDVSKLCKLSHLLNYQNSFKILPNLGISLHQRVGAVLVDHLMTFWCPILREKTSWCLWCPDSRPDVHTKAWGPLDWMEVPSVDADVGAQKCPCVPNPSLGYPGPR